MVENRKFQDCFCHEKILGMSYCEKRTRDGKWVIKSNQPDFSFTSWRSEIRPVCHAHRCPLMTRGIRI